MSRKPSVKELGRRADLIGTVYAKAYLGELSAEDRDDLVRNDGICSQLREAYTSAVADVGSRSAMKSAVNSALTQADAAIYGARRERRALGSYGDCRPIREAAEQAVRKILSDEPSQRPVLQPQLCSRAWPAATATSRDQDAMVGTGPEDQRLRPGKALRHPVSDRRSSPRPHARQAPPMAIFTAKHALYMALGLRRGGADARVVFRVGWEFLKGRRNLDAPVPQRAIGAG
jgi:hypothetical protein